MQQEGKALLERVAGTPTIREAGRLPEQQLLTYYQAADLFVLPTSAAEGFGLVSIEALACNLPVFGTPVGGIREVLQRVNPELLFADATAAAMASSS